MDKLGLKPLEDLVNRGIEQSAEASSACRNLSGRRLLIDPRGLPGFLVLAVEENRLQIYLTDDSTADCRISGLPIGLLRTGMSGTAEALRQGAAELSGDSAIAQDFGRLMDMARPDWEEELSRLVGDVIAHRLGNLARGLIGWGRNAVDTLATDSGEYLAEESRQVPTRFELEEFLEEVDRLRDDVERCTARLKRLEDTRHGERG